VKMLEILKGNEGSITGMSLEKVLESHVSLFLRHPFTNNPVVLSQDATSGAITKTGGREDDMIRGGPIMANNHDKNRKNSRNEVVI
jgi:hypothetical protein